MSPRAFEDVLRFNGLSISKVADLADIQRATISGLLGGHARASTPMAHRIADATGAHPETLFPTLREHTFAEVESAAA